jgi:glutamate-5-semialdehyde dehydrogenase
MPQSVIVARTLTEKLDAARAASLRLATANAALKNRALEAIAVAVVANADRIIAANDVDLTHGRDNGLSAGMQDRLRLDPPRLAGLADAVRLVATLVDPVGENVRGQTLPNGVRRRGRDL